MITRISTFSFSALLFIVTACNILKSEDQQQAVLNFLGTFQTKLQAPQEEINALFDARQSPEVISGVVSILQNKEHEYINCTAAFAQASVVEEEEGIKVIIPASFDSKGIEETFHENANLTLWLKPSKNSFVISKVEGEEFYKAFASIKSNMEWRVERKREEVRREPIYARARELEQQFDSVVWFTTYQEKNYYYVVSGAWVNYFMRYDENPQTPSYQMGLVNEAGEIIIPLEYELIGTIGFDQPNIVEVKKNGKSGWFDIEARKALGETSYDIIIPYRNTDVKAIVKTDTTFGWLTDTFEYKKGFPSAEAKKWVKSFSFLPTSLRIHHESTAMCEIPRLDDTGYGIVMPPSYLVKNGIFKEIVGGITTTPVPINGWTEYVETNGTRVQNITEKINAVITSITEHYLEGREEFYTENRLTFVNEASDTLAIASIPTDSVIHMKRIGNVLEIKSPAPYYWFEGGMYEDYNLPMYTYFMLGDEFSVKPLRTVRTFASTEFVKLDSSYLMGSFSHWNRNTDEEEQTDFLSVATIEYMRNEILAFYGFKFSDPSVADHFVGFSWYSVKHENMESLEADLTEIDKHNLAFLEKILVLLKTKAV